MRIGELAKQAGISTSAIRFYEASGLLPAGARGQNRYREYGADALKRLQGIQLARRLGISLDSLRSLFAQNQDEVRRVQMLAGIQKRREEIAQTRVELEEQDAELAWLEQLCVKSLERGECVTQEVIEGASRRARKAA